MFQLKQKMESVVILIFQSHPSSSHPLWYNSTVLGRQGPFSSKPWIFSTTPRKVNIIFSKKEIIDQADRLSCTESKEIRGTV